MRNSLRRLLVLTHSRNIEFLRDRQSLGWNIVFPLILILGFGLGFEQSSQTGFTVATVGSSTSSPLSHLSYIRSVSFKNLDQALSKLRHHKVDLVVKKQQRPFYWINEASQKSYFAEKLLKSTHQESDSGWVKKSIHQPPIRYIDWVLPGILAMNMMFSALYGVGYTMIRYRKNGVLKRFKVTPLRSVEFVCAQIISRVLICLATSIILYLGYAWIFDFRFEGSYLTLISYFSIGTIAMVSVGLFMAIRSTSEELAEGLINLISWPMVLLSEIWFSLEGFTSEIQTFSEYLPLTHLVRGMRAIMNDGAGWDQLYSSAAYMLFLTFVLILISSAFFKWTRN